MIHTILEKSRYIILIGVICSFIGALTLFIYGAVLTWTIDFSVFVASKFTGSEAKALSVDFIVLIDLFLLGTVLYIFALGLYELFIDEGLHLPPWLIITNLDDLKAKLIKVIIVLLGVTFLANAVSWNGSISILYLGVASSLIIFALGLVTGFNFSHHAADNHGDDVS